MKGCVCFISSNKQFYSMDLFRGISSHGQTLEIKMAALFIGFDFVSPNAFFSWLLSLDSSHISSVCLFAL